MPKKADPPSPSQRLRQLFQQAADHHKKLAKDGKLTLKDLEVTPEQQTLLEEVAKRARVNGLRYGSSGKSIEEFFSTLTLKEHQYLPAGPGLTDEGLLAYRWLLACKAEGIPESKWPRLQIEILDVRVQGRIKPFVPPPFNVDADSHQDYVKQKRKAEAKHQTSEFAKIDRQIELHVRKGLLIRQKQRRGSDKAGGSGKQAAPMELRLRWAALHHCEGRSYGWLQRNRNPEQRYTVGGITKATQRVLDELGLRKLESRSLRLEH